MTGRHEIGKSTVPLELEVSAGQLTHARLSYHNDLLPHEPGSVVQPRANLQLVIPQTE
jgi:hypothetical protein